MNGQTKFLFEKLVNNSKIKSVLNIGYRHTSDPTIKNACEMVGKKFSVLEVFSENCKFMRQFGIDVIEMNVIDIATLDKNFDAIIWLHGPEHILWEEFKKCRKDIEAKSNYLTIYQAPIGEYPQDELYGNPYEKHISTLDASMFSELGYNVLNHTENGEKTFSAWIEK